MIELFYADTPNGRKISIMLEEIQFPYKISTVKLLEGEQFKSKFRSISPFSKIPVIIDHENNTSVFESGAILLYLSEKFGAFMPTKMDERTECLSWLFWQMASAPYLGGGFGHFYAYAPEKFEYPINRFAMETKRQLDLLDQRLSKTEFIAGSSYTIADMAIWAWYGNNRINREIY